ncbi:MAG: SprT-like domain-containing protein [Lewinella sp.]|uniref:SprT-like domain-containing protein n=1 Tax=Lewinella sp. TaxID=2004506 RepID=UPI003D6BA6E6
MNKKTKNSPLPTPTEEQFQALNRAYQYFNSKLFDGLLPGCILNFSRKKNTHGFMAPERWRRVGEEEYSTHEISLTPLTLYRKPIEVFSTLVHEQVHLWQWEFGSPSRNGYHNTEWANKMEQVGLMPSSTGKPGGKRTGQGMTHYIIPGGLYETYFKEMPQKFTLPFASLEGDLFKRLISGGVEGKGETEDPRTARLKKLRTTSRQKTKYSCPSCSINVWGKPNIHLICGGCGVPFKVVE